MSPISNPPPTVPWRTRAGQVWYQITKPHPSIKQPERRRARLLLAVLATLIFIGAAAALVTFALDGLSRDFQITLAAVATIAAIYGLGRTRHYLWASAATIAVVYVPVWTVAVYSKEIWTLDFLVLGILMGSLFFSARVTMLLASLALGLVLALPAFVPGLRPEDIATVGFLLGSLSLVATVAAQVRRQDLAQIANQARMLRAEMEEHRQAEETSRASDARYRRLFDSLLNGFALHEVICDEAGQPVDYRFLEVNPSFERLTGLRAANLIGQTARAILPGLEPAWIQRFGAVALTGEPVHFTDYNRDLDRHYEVTAYSPKPGQFAVLFNDVTERQRAEDRVNAQLRQMESLHAIDLAIANSLDVRLTLKVIVEAAASQLGVDAASILLYKPASNQLEFAAGLGFRTQHVQRGRLRLGEGVAGRAALERRPIRVPNLAEEDEFTRAPLFAGEGFIAYYGMPLVAKGQIKGVLEVFHRSAVNRDEEWLNFLDTLAGQAAIAIDSAQAFEALQRANLELSLAYDATIEGWSRAMDLRDEETEGHTRRVTELTVRLAVAAGMSEADIVHVRRGALLHDMGKLGVPDHILRKPGPLSDEEWAIMRQHPQFAFDMLAPIAYLHPALDIPYGHHEKWDGTGYPRGLKGPEIPLAARLFAVADVWDALRSDRPYRQAWPEAKVLEHIRSLAGRHFDPMAVELFLRVVRAEVEEPRRGEVFPADLGASLPPQQRD